MEEVDSRMLEIYDDIYSSQRQSTKEFIMQRGLWKGDLLSPFLFLIADEGFRKWKWKIKTERIGLWLKALKNRYGETEVMRGDVNRKDSNWWKNICEIDIGAWENSTYFSVKEMYKGLKTAEPDQSSISWSKVWHKVIPPNISCFGWRLFQNGLATKNNLFRRNVIGQGSTSCIEDCDANESIPHLFFECKYFSGIWQSICKWLRISTALHSESRMHFAQFEGLIGGDKETSLKVRVIWFAGVWSIWKARNAKIFSNKDMLYLSGGDLSFSRQFAVTLRQELGFGCPSSRLFGVLV
ncbi:uncharacterized protein LOC131635723 [Vicia villosa]|uniref:uncharacterized protein LOC131635723 n=1 Tax=Vicia villosa TaxID=3911 RepID=UPI00273CA8E6|nr:uncharacterized protein LOC131635723 [Vicia villosa]